MNNVQYQTIEDTIQDKDEKMKIKKIMKAIIKAKSQGKTAIDDSAYLDDALKTGRDRVLPKLKSDLRKLTNDLKYKQQQVDQIRKEVQKRMDEISLYEKQVKEMENFNIKKIVKDVGELHVIDNIEVDFYGRVIVTTKPLTVTYNIIDAYGNMTKEQRTMDVGRYQIRIDFSQEYYSDAIRAVNLDWYSVSGNPHPCIGSSTNFCWGNLGKDMERDYKSFDVIEIIRSLGEFLRSGMDGHGHTRWFYWREKVVPTPEGYSLAMYDEGVRWDDVQECFFDKHGNKLPSRKTKESLNDRPADNSHGGATY